MKILILISVLVSACTAGPKKSRSVPSDAGRKSAPEIPYLGGKNASLVIYEYSDFECPYCRKAQKSHSEIRAKYGNRIKWIFKDFPLDSHDNAMTAHIYSNCAAEQGKYWEYFRLLFENSGRLSEENLKDLASSVQMDSGRLSECSERNSVRQSVENSRNSGITKGVQGTPTLFIGSRMVPGARPFENLDLIIAEELGEGN